MDISDTFMRFGLALGLGLLVGLQRERAGAGIAGFRTFALVSLTGAVCGRLSIGLGGWVLAAGFLALAAVLFVGNLIRTREDGDGAPGLTTEVAALLMFGVGAFAAVGAPQVAAAVGGATMVLLQWKPQLHGFASRIGEEDVRGVVQFVVVTLIVLPILPDRDYGPYGVLNPRQIWWMVVLIVALSLAAYVGYKLLGRRAGTWLGGILGGLVSSTATTVAYARRVRDGEVSAAVAAQVVLIATAVVYLRLLVMLGVVWPALLADAAAPLMALLLLQALFALRGLRQPEAEHEPMVQSNPTELRTALAFGAVFAVVLVAVAWAKDQLSSEGLFSVAALSGLVDLDALTLSTAQLAKGGRLAADLVWRLIVCASIANMLFKTVVVAVLGRGKLLRGLVLPWGIGLLVGAAMIAFWPGPAALLP